MIMNYVHSDLIYTAGLWIMYTVIWYILQDYESCAQWSDTYWRIMNACMCTVIWCILQDYEYMHLHSDLIHTAWLWIMCTVIWYILQDYESCAQWFDTYCRIMNHDCAQWFDTYCRIMNHDCAQGFDTYFRIRSAYTTVTWYLVHFPWFWGVTTV